MKYTTLKYIIVYSDTHILQRGFGNISNASSSILIKMQACSLNNYFVTCLLWLYIKITLLRRRKKRIREKGILCKQIDSKIRRKAKNFALQYKIVLQRVYKSEKQEKIRKEEGHYNLYFIFTSPRNLLP